jgi:hypothetical protein
MSILRGGVSFGFLVINNAKLDSRCRAILAMEPFVNTKCLNTSFMKKKGYIVIKILFKLIKIFNIEKQIWESNWFNWVLQKESDYPKERVNTIIEHIDPRTFFSVANFLSKYDKNPDFHNLPHFLIGNFKDKTINFNSVVEVFKKSLRKLRIFSVPIDHYPKDLTKAYFKTRIPKEHLSRMLACIEGGDEF